MEDAGRSVEVERERGPGLRKVEDFMVPEATVAAIRSP